MALSGIINEVKYIAISELHEEKGYTVKQLCEKLDIARSAYYKWKNREKSNRQITNEEIAERIKELHKNLNGILGYKRMTMFINNIYGTNYNHKRIRRIMIALGISSDIRRKGSCCTRPSKEQMIAENILNRNFKASKVNEKWLTDVTEFKYGNGEKLYLSAILDLFDRRIVAYTIGKHNNNALVFKNFDEAVKLNADAHPLFHSDRGFQYTNKTFKHKLISAGMRQSMSRVGKCIDNGPMEGFWGIIKSEMYYLNDKFETYEELETAIKNYIEFYNNDRYQAKLGAKSPLEFNKENQAA
ncbi:IS3 family transposase [bacterium]|nr:IS3 family transposase [bacterium]